MDSHRYEPQAIELGPGRLLGAGHPALVVAELGQNHNGRRELAEQLVDAAAWAGADAVKVVKRDLRCELSREGRQRPYGSRHAYGRTYGAHRAALELSAEDHAALRDRARQHGLLFIATACDEPSVELMESLGVDAFKIASRDLANEPLLDAVARRGRPVFVSTGMSSLAEIDRAVAVLDGRAARSVLMQCTSLYPTPTDQVHLRSMVRMGQRYGRLAGFSDHTQGILMAPVAVALGAAVVEKHLTMDQQFKGTDHALSVEPEGLRRLVEAVRQVERALGSPEKPVAPGVDEVREKLGRSLVVRHPLRAGTRINESMLTLKSPGNGIAWSQREKIIGGRLTRDVAADEQLRLDDVA